MKHTNKHFGGGAGHYTYSSKLFEVTLWHSQKGINTAITFADHHKLTFEGNQTESFKTDCQCLAVLRPSDVLNLLKYTKKEGISEGRRNIQQEIKKALNR